MAGPWRQWPWAAWLVLLVAAATIATATAPAPGAECSGVPREERVQCGLYVRYETEASCRARGCCWEPLGNPLAACFYPEAHPAVERVATVHVVQGCHLDVGFAGGATAILNEWFEEHLPNAARIGAELARLNQTGVGLQFTAQSWVVSLFFDCPPRLQAEMGLRCPNASTRALVEAGVRAGHITWHAFPFNSEPEVLDASLFGFALDLTHGVDDRFGLARKRVLSQRDVPGLTRAAVPLLVRHNITTVSVGVNGGSTPPNVPMVFRWLDPPSGTAVNALFVSGGYGGIDLFDKRYHVTTLVPNSSHALVVAWEGDNAGPPGVATVNATFESLRRQFPRARIASSSFDAFAATLGDGAGLPVVTAEIGDTWIHGVASDPLKLAQARAAQSLRAACLASGACSSDDARVFNFSRLLLKNAEHTWGRDQKSALAPPAFLHANWANADFDAVRSDPRYQGLEQSWAEQRALGLDQAVAALGSHPLAAQVRAAWSGLATGGERTPDLAGFRCFTNQTAFVVGGRRVEFGTDGPYLQRGAGTGNGEMGRLRYMSFDGLDYAAFLARYNYLSVLYPLDDWDDYDKVGIDRHGHARHTDTPAAYGTFANTTATDGGTEVWYSAAERRFLLPFAFPAAQSRDAGAPPRGWLDLTVRDDARLELTVAWQGKRPTRLPEALFLSFSAPAGEGAVFTSAQKLGGAVAVGGAGDVVEGGSQHLHVVERLTGPGLNVSSPHCPLVCFGTATAFPTPTTVAPDRSQAHFVLLNNLWNTNYVMYYPFAAADADAAFNLTLEVAP